MATSQDCGQFSHLLSPDLLRIRVPGKPGASPAPASEPQEEAEGCPPTGPGFLFLIWPPRQWWQGLWPQHLLTRGRGVWAARAALGLPGKAPLPSAEARPPLCGTVRKGAGARGLGSKCSSDPSLADLPEPGDHGPGCRPWGFSQESWEALARARSPAASLPIIRELEKQGGEGTPAPQ